MGHLVDRLELANDDEYSFVDHRQPGNYDLHEFFADEFAGELLMPAEEMLKLREEKIPEAVVADTFGVSISAVRKRYQRLDRSPHRDDYQVEALVA